jgi:hypothetical protein
MAISDFHGETFVAFLDISGFKDLMKNDSDALEALRRLYQTGYDVLKNRNGVEGFFVSDSGVLFVRNGNNVEKLKKILNTIKMINKKMLRFDYMLTTSIAYGAFDYEGKLEFKGIEKNPIYGNAYVKAYLDNEKSQPKIQPGQCRLMIENLPEEINLDDEGFSFLKQRKNDRKHLYYYWSVTNQNGISNFENDYSNSYKLKFSGMLQALKNSAD